MRLSQAAERPDHDLIGAAPHAKSRQAVGHFVRQHAEEQDAKQHQTIDETLPRIAGRAQILGRHQIQREDGEQQEEGVQANVDAIPLA